jgi:UDP-N-acetyl-D-mannosaminuronic acid dehydrogenase
MPESLNVTVEEVDTCEKRGNFTTSIIGCSKEGMFYSIAFAEAGYRVIITDADQSAIRRLSKGKMSFTNEEFDQRLKNLVKTGKITATSEQKNAITQSEIIVVANMARIDLKNKIDYKEVENDCKQIGTALRKGTLIIFGAISGLGFIEGIAKEEIENASGLKVGIDFGLAYSPPSHYGMYSVGAIDNLELQVAALESVSQKAASTILRTIAKKGVTEVPNIKTLELSALFGALQRDINVALSNELSILCETLGQNYFDAIKLLDKTNPNINMQPSIFGENDKIPVHMLLDSAENVNVKLRIPAIARQINEEMIKHAVTLAQEALRSCGKTLRRARIALLGVPTQRSITRKLVKIFETKGAKINVYDPTLSENAKMEMAINYKKTFNEAVEGTDCIIILFNQDQIKKLNLKKLHAEMKNPSALVDLTGTVEQDKVEKEDFIFLSIGKGMIKK